MAAQVSGLVLGCYLDDLTKCSDSRQPHSFGDSELPGLRGITAFLLSCSSATSMQARGLQVGGGHMNDSPPPVASSLSV